MQMLILADAGKKDSKGLLILFLNSKYMHDLFQLNIFFPITQN